LGAAAAAGALALSPVEGVIFIMIAGAVTGAGTLGAGGARGGVVVVDGVLDGCGWEAGDVSTCGVTMPGVGPVSGGLAPGSGGVEVEGVRDGNNLASPERGSS